MNANNTIPYSNTLLTPSIPYHVLLRVLVGGLLLPLGFAPFHLPGLSILGIALFFSQLHVRSPKQSFYLGFVFGLSFLGFGVSWVYVSIHEYGHLNALLSGVITALFVAYLSLYPGLASFLYHKFARNLSPLRLCLLFSALWCLSEYLRATIMGGFPWLLLGFGQIDSPLKYLLPFIGVYGVSFFTCLAGTILATSVSMPHKARASWIVAFVMLLITPLLLKHPQGVSTDDTPVSVGVIQANLSMRDKWDESLFWQLLDHYKQGIDKLVGKKQLIVMPESAIPLPASYISDFLEAIHVQATQAGSAILLGIPQATSTDENSYYNALITLGTAKGSYLKQHLVPFGEFIPPIFNRFAGWLALPSANLKPGTSHQPLIMVQGHPVATLICYELAYPELLRNQLPDAEWLVSISDDGWFGHSLAMYQQLQIAQTLSMLTSRYQVVANNDGLSALINTEGEVMASLPAFHAGTLESMVYPSTGQTPWARFGDNPFIILIILIILASTLKSPIAARDKRGYPYQPN